MDLFVCLLFFNQPGRVVPFIFVLGEVEACDKYIMKLSLQNINKMNKGSPHVLGSLFSTQLGLRFGEADKYMDLAPYSDTHL